MNQGMRVAFRNWKRQRSRPCPRVSRKECSHANTLTFSPAGPVLDFCPTEPQDNKFVVFKATEFVAICYNTNRKLID